MNINVGGYRAAICPQCGGQLNVEQGQKFVKCDFCGTISATADVHYHEHKETHNHYHGNVQFGGQDLETLVKNADTLIRLGDYSAAYSVYDKICKSYPHDYRGWWGMILTATDNLTDYNLIIDKEKNTANYKYWNELIENYWKKVKQTAPHDTLSSLGSKIEAYYNRCRKVLFSKTNLLNNAETELKRSKHYYQRQVIKGGMLAVISLFAVIMLLATFPWNDAFFLPLAVLIITASLYFFSFRSIDFKVLLSSIGVGITWAMAVVFIIMLIRGEEASVLIIIIPSIIVGAVLFARNIYCSPQPGIEAIREAKAQIAIAESNLQNLKNEYYKISH